jgi:PAS domain S-box-containing protein
MLAAILAGMIGLMLHVYVTARRMATFQAPLVYAVKQIELETILGHLGFEEVLHGERDGGLDSVWAHYRTAIGYADAMLKGGTSPEGPISPLDDPALRRQVAEFKDRFRDLEEVTRQRFARERSLEPDSELQERYHRLFYQLMGAAERVEAVIDGRMEREVSQFRSIHLGLIGLGVLGASLIGGLFLRFERSTKEQYQAVAAARGLAAVVEERFRLLFEHMADPLFVVDAAGRFLDVNRRACEVLGYARGELLTMSVTDVEVQHSAAEVSRINSQLEVGQSVLLEGTHRRKDGTTFPVEVHLQAMRWEDQPVVIGLARDISERKRAERALRESEQWYQSLAEVSPVGIFRTDVEGGCLYVNYRWSQIAGLDLSQALGRRWADALHPDDREAVINGWKASAKEGRPFHMEYRFRSPAGVTTWVIGSARTVRDANGEVLGHVGTITDISDRKRMEEELRAARDELELRVRERTTSLEAANRRLLTEIEQRAAAEESLRYSEAKYSKLVTSSPVGIFIYRDGQFVFVNPALVAMSGYTEKEFLAMDLGNLVHPEDRAWVQQIARRRLAGEAVPQEYEVRCLTKAAETRWLHVRTVLIEYRGGPSTLGNVTDVTESKRMSAALEGSREKLRRLSNEILTAQEEERARIARELHDSIGQSLSAIKFHVESAIPRCGATGTAEQHLRAVVGRVQDTVEEVRRISMALRPSLLDDLGLLATIRWHCRQFESRYPDLAVTQELDAAEGEVPDRLKIVIFRLLQEAMSNAGEHSGCEGIEISLSLQGHLLELRVTDDGKGIDWEEMEERPASLRGYGLASMRERTEMSGGQLSIELPEGGGTVIRATWDLAPESTA